MKNLLLLFWMFCSVAMAVASQSAAYPNQILPFQKQGPVVPVANQNPVTEQIGPSEATGSSQAVVVGEAPLAHTTQLLPLDKKGGLVGKGDINRQVSQVMDNMALALKAADSKLANVVKINIYL